MNITPQEAAILRNALAHWIVDENAIDASPEHLTLLRKLNAAMPHGDLSRYDKGDDSPECDYCTEAFITVWPDGDTTIAACDTHGPRVQALADSGARFDRETVLADVARYHQEKGSRP